MSTQKDKEKLELLQGTPDLLILRTLIFGPQHGQWIARAIQESLTKNCSSSKARYILRCNSRKSDGQPLQITGGLVSIPYRPRTTNNLAKETAKWNRLAKAIGRILESEPARG